MSSDATVAPSRSSAAAAATTSAATRMALRLGVGVALGFVLGALSGTAFFFLPPLLAAQFLATMRQPPSLRQGIGAIILVVLFGGLTLFLASSFAGRPLVYVILVGLVLFYGFLLDTAGKTMAASLLLTLGATIPLTATQSTESAVALAGAFVGAVAIAVLTTWAMFAAFPAPGPTSPAVAPPARQASPRVALANTAVLLPVLVMFMISGRMTFVLLLVIVAILRLSERSASPRAALGLLLGNLLGGGVATVAYGFVTVQPSAVFFLLIVLLVGLAFGARIAAGDALAPVFTIALVAFVILLGLGVSPLPTESGEAFTARVWNVLLAGAYATGALSLLQRRG